MKRSVVVMRVDPRRLVGMDERYGLGRRGNQWVERVLGLVGCRLVRVGRRCCTALCVARDGRVSNEIEAKIKEKNIARR